MFILFLSSYGVPFTEEWMPYKTELPIHKNESIVLYSKIDDGPKEAQYAK